MGFRRPRAGAHAGIVDPGATSGYLAGRQGGHVSDALLLDAIEKAIREESESVRGLAITADSLLVDDLGLDSLDLVAVVLKLEDQLHVPIGVQEIKNFRSVADLVDLIHRLRETSAAA